MFMMQCDSSFTSYDNNVSIVSGTGCERQVSCELPRASTEQFLVTGEFLFQLLFVLKNLIKREVTNQTYRAGVGELSALLPEKA